MSPLWIILTLLPILGGAARFNCKGRILGAYYADSKSGCKAFHVCVRVAGGGIRDFRFFCPPGTLFHQEAQTCTDWGDDDPLACPAIYDGQFDLYKIHSGFETKKLSSVGNREEEAEFGLQRAETGDRRSQNNANDLRAAHSSDFFSGQRDRGRDEPAQTPPQPQPQPDRTAAPPVPRQSFRRATTPRPQPTTPRPQPNPQPTTQSPQPTYQPQYEVSKRKIVRKRPVYASSPAPPSTFAQNPTQYQDQQPFQDKFNRRPQQQSRQPPTTTPNVPPQFKEYKDEYVEVSRVTPKPNRYYPANPTPLPSSHATSPPQYNKQNDGLIELYNYDAQSTPGLTTKQGKYKVKNSFSVTDLPQEDFARIRPNNNNFNNNNNNFNNNNNNFNNNNNNFNDNNNNFNNNNFNENNNNKDNFNNNKKEDFNNNYYIKKDDFNNNNNFKNTNRPAPTTTIDYNSAARTTTNTPTYKNFNSVSYEPEKNNFVSFAKNYNNPTTIPTTTYYTTYRAEPPQNLNTVAYDTNNGFHSQSNFAEPSSEDDGQYRPPQGEDDGQYRPELYERELLSGAHSLNIAASGNRLPEDQKHSSKTKAPTKFVSQTAAPRPFRPAPTQTTRAPEPTTTVSPQTQRAFDLFQTYTTTSRPTDYTGGPPDFVPINNAPIRPTTTARVETRPPKTQTRPAHAPTFPPNPAPRPTTQPPFSKPVNKKEDNSYDYAYYDSDPGFSDYDRIEEFGRTKKRE